MELRLSVISPIRDIRFEDVTAGCRCLAVNMDAARYCRTPLFKDEDQPDGVGCIENIVFDEFTTWWSQPGARKALIDAESRVRNFVIRNFRRDGALDRAPDVPTLMLDKTPGIRVEALNGATKVMDAVSGREPLALSAPFTDLRLG